MAYQSQFYTTGTVTVTDGSAIVTGSETGWETALIEGGVFYVLGSAYPILSVEDETKLTLAIPFSGQGMAGIAYAIDRQRSAAVSSITMNDRLAAIIASIHGAQPESDLLSAFAALQGADGKLPIFTSKNTLGLVDHISDEHSSLSYLAKLSNVGNLTDLAGIDLQPNQLMVSDVNAKLSQVSAVEAGMVSVNPQRLTLEQQGQARTNIGAGILAGWRNKIINGDLNVWQRGLSFTIAAGGVAYTADRWLIANTTNQPVTILRGAFLPGAYDDVPGSPSFVLVASFAVAPTTGSLNIIQRIEGVRTLEGKRATARAYISGPANAGALDFDVTQIFGSGGSPSANVVVPKTSLDVATINNPGGNIRKKNAIIDLPSLAGKSIGTNGNDNVQYRWLLSARQAGTYIFGRASFVEGDATAEDDPFAPRHPQQEEDFCMQYYAKTFSLETTPTNGAGFGGAISASTLSIGEAVATWQFPQLMRAPPSMTFFNPGSGASGMWRNFADTASVAVNTFGPSSNRGCILVATSGPTTQHIAIHATADAEL